MEKFVVVSNARFVKRSYFGRRVMVLLSLALVIAFVLSVGCGGVGAPTAANPGPSPAPPPPTPPPSPFPPTNTVLVNLGEFLKVTPDNVVAFELNIDSVRLHSSKGDAYLLSSVRHLELGTLKPQPLLLTTVDQGTYSGIEIAISNVSISYIDANGTLHEKVPATLTTSTIANPSAFTVGSTPIMINLNPLFTVNLGASGAVSVNPALDFSTRWTPTPDLVGRFMDEGNSWISVDFEDLPPTVDPSYYDGNFGFLTDSSTVFQGFHTQSEITAESIVEVDAVLGTDGQYRATRVKLVAAPVVVEGLTLATLPAQLQMLVREGRGPYAMGRPAPGKMVTVNVTASTEFHFYSDRIDLTNLDFTPNFDALNIAPGQNIRAGTQDGSTPTIAADQISLEKQWLDGTAGTVVAGSVPGQYVFPLNVAADSAFAKLTGHTTVFVTIQPSTEKILNFGSENCVTCIAGGPVRARGLLFLSGGQYRMVAEKLAVN